MRHSPLKKEIPEGVLDKLEGLPLYDQLKAVSLGKFTFITFLITREGNTKVRVL